MTSDDLTKRQISTLKAQVDWVLHNLCLLQRRMIKRKFLPNIARTINPKNVYQRRAIAQKLSNE